jgi:hypothetical protein
MLVTASSYPFLDVMWSMLIFFAFFIWIWIAITVFIDLIRRKDMSGWVKALWVVLIIVLPYLGVLVYLIAYHNSMADRQNTQAQQAQSQFDDYVRQTAAGAGGASAEIEKAKGLLDNGTINQAEFDALKAKALSHS